MKKKIAILSCLGVGCSLVALYFALRNVPLAALGDYLLRINYLWMFPAMLAIFLAFALRAQRWKIILATTHEVSFRQSFHPLMIGFMLNLVLPGRMGEVARPLILRKQENIPFTTGLATVAAERLLDLVMLLSLFVVTIAIVQIDPHLDMTFGNQHLNSETLEAVAMGMARAGFVLIAAMGVLVLNPVRRKILSLINALPVIFFWYSENRKEKVRRKVCKPLARMVDNISRSFSLIRNTGRLCLCFSLSIVIWALHVFSYYLIALGSPGIELGFFELTATMIIVCFFIVLPAAPGFWGLWEAGGVFALALFGISAKDAAGFTLVNHVIQMVPVMLIGIFSALVTGVNILSAYQTSISEG